jgi:hypothetical protein
MTVDTSDAALLALADRLWESKAGRDIRVEVCIALRTIVAERQAKPATGDVVETLAKALWAAGAGFDDKWEESGPHAPFLASATALLAQIGPALRAEGVEMAAAKLASAVVTHSLDWVASHCNGLLQELAAELTSDAKRLREGGEG